MDDAIVVVERNEGTGRETVTLVDPASGFSLLVDDEPLTKGANETNVPSAPVAAVVVAALSELELKENPHEDEAHPLGTHPPARSPSWAGGRRPQPPRGARDQQRPCGRQHRRLRVGDLRLARQAVRHHQLDPAGGARRRLQLHRFSDDVLYEIHVARGNQSLEDVVTYQFQFQDRAIQRVDPADLAAPPGGGKGILRPARRRRRTYTVTKIVGRGGNRQERVIAQDVPVAPPRIGPRTQSVANALGLAPYTSPVYDDAFAATFVRDMGERGARLRRPA